MKLHYINFVWVLYTFSYFVFLFYSSPKFKLFTFGTFCVLCNSGIFTGLMQGLIA